MKFQEIISKTQDLPEGYTVKEDAFISGDYLIVERNATPEEVEEYRLKEERWQKVLEERAEAAKKAEYMAQRERYLDAYRKYQAAVAFGEFESAEGVGSFIDALKAKDWSVFEHIPPALGYFLGEIRFEDSGLILASKIKDIIQG